MAASGEISMTVDTRVGGQPRASLAAVGAVDAQVQPWLADPGGSVRSLEYHGADLLAVGDLACCLFVDAEESVGAPETESTEAIRGAQDLVYMNATSRAGGARARRPDVLVRRGTTGTLLGNGIYNETGVRQAVSGSAGRGGSDTFVATVQNDGRPADTYRIHGAVGDSRFNAAYFRGATNITRQVDAGTYRIRLTPGARAEIRIVLSPRNTATLGMQASVTLRASSMATPGRADVVRITIHRS